MRSAPRRLLRFRPAHTGQRFGRRTTRRGAATAEFSEGDEVEWNTPQGTTHGKVVDKRTKDFQLAGQHFTASEEEPMFIVESDKSGAQAAHRPEALSRRG